MSNTSNTNKSSYKSQLQVVCRKCRAKHNVYEPNNDVERLKCERCEVRFFTKDLSNGKIELGITPEEVKNIWLKELKEY